MRHLLNHMLTRLRSERGAAMVEFAIVLPVVLALVLGIVDFGKAFNYDNDLTELSATAARTAAVNSNAGTGAVTGDCAGSSFENYICDRASSPKLKSLIANYAGTGNVGPSGARGVCVAFPAGPTGTHGQVGDPVQVKISVTYRFLKFPVLNAALADKRLVSHATMRIERKATNPPFSATDLARTSCP